MSAQIGTPVQRGVGYEAMAAPKLRTTSDGASYVLVPVASSAAIRAVANGVETEDGEGDVDNFGTGNHHLVYQGDFKLRSGTDVPVKGDVFYDDGTATGSVLAYVVTGDPEVKNFGRTTGAPFLVNLELKHWPKVAGEIS